MVNISGDSFGLISVIMPACNAQSFIADAINSVLQQTYKNWELIVVDDGSIDQTGEVVRQFAATDERIRYFYQNNGRQGKARNLALNNAKGKWIAFLDADDIMLAERLAIQVKQIVNENVDLIFGNACMFKALPLTGCEQRFAVAEACYAAQKGICDFLEGNKIPILTVLVNRNALVKVGGFTEETNIQNAEDYHLWLKLLLNGFSIKSLDVVVGAYRLHAMSMTSSDSIASVQVLYALKDLSEHFPEKPEIKQSFNQNLLRYYKSIRNYEIQEFQIAANTIFNLKKKPFLMFRFFKLIEYVLGRKFSLSFLYRICLSNG